MRKAGFCQILATKGGGSVVIQPPFPIFLALSLLNLGNICFIFKERQKKGTLL